ncbi:hypothetical protein [Paenibacillus aestuarii]|uniref:Uncharacterized protein n=1 Tax=Paenibacillus aestuarii TaxID=516965 RepID=A0ABW0JZY0_9BACL|nr:hypothetical protein [Paenibacillus aestuarii]
MLDDLLVLSNHLIDLLGYNDILPVANDNELDEFHQELKKIMQQFLQKYDSDGSIYFEAVERYNSILNSFIDNYVLREDLPKLLTGLIMYNLTQVLIRTKYVIDPLNNKLMSECKKDLEDPITHIFWDIEERVHKIFCKYN